MKKSTAVTSLLLIGSLGMLAARLLSFDLRIDNLEEDLADYCC